MKRGKLIISATLAFCAVAATSSPFVLQKSLPPVATFRSSIDLVRVSAVVRDKKGRFVQDLTVRDFEVLDGGLSRRITDFRKELSGISLALLFDVSGSMESQMEQAREAARHVLSWLDNRDETAIYTFDTQLDEVAPFTPGLRRLPTELSRVTPFGATSLNDAIARTAERLGSQEGRRRAVVVFTDGRDNASRLTTLEVSTLASSIDVPVYVVEVVAGIDNPTAETAAIGPRSSALAGALKDLAHATGGATFVVSGPAERSMIAHRIVDELRHQYLIAFESSGQPGWHPLVVRSRAKDLTVRARSGYVAGQSRPRS